MSGRDSLRLIALAIAVYAVYTALSVAPLFAAAASPVILLIGIVEAATAAIAAIGLWRQERWAPAAVVTFGVVLACAQLVEGPVLGLIANLLAILVGAIELVLAIVIAAYARQSDRAIA